MALASTARVTPFIELRGSELIAWGPAEDGLSVGIGRVRLFDGNRKNVIIDAYLRNQGNESIQDIAEIADHFSIEIDGRFYAANSQGGPVRPLSLGKSIGPIVIDSSNFRKTDDVRHLAVDDSSPPAPPFARGRHVIRIYYAARRPFAGSAPVEVHFDDAPRAPVAAIAALAALVAQTDPRDYQTRNLAVRGLERFPGAPGAAALVGILSDRDSSTRTLAAAALASTKSETTTEILFRTLVDPDEEVRRAAATSLGKIGDKKDVPRLKEVLGDASMRVRFAAVEALVKLGEPLDVEWVVPIIKSNSGNESQNAIWMLRRNAGTKAVPTLIRCLDFKDPSVKNYQNHTLIWHIAAAGGPTLKYNFDFEGHGSPEQIEENRRTLEALAARLPHVH